MNHYSGKLVHPVVVIFCTFGKTLAQEDTDSGLSGVYLAGILSGSVALAITLLVFICVHANKKDKEKSDIAHGTLEAGENDSYVDPETWGTDEPIMGQRHSLEADTVDSTLTDETEAPKDVHPLASDANQNEWITYGPDTIRENSIKAPSVSDSVDETAELKRLSEWSSVHVPRTTAPTAPTITPTDPVVTSNHVKPASIIKAQNGPRTLPPVPSEPVPAPKPAPKPAPVPVVVPVPTIATVAPPIDDPVPSLPPKVKQRAPPVPVNNNHSSVNKDSIRSSKDELSLPQDTNRLSTISAYSSVSNRSKAEENQDKTLAELGLYRYKIPGDGNCLFRAVASQLRLPQGRFHLILRKAAAQWMREHKDELMEQGLLENDDELSATETEGQWPGHAAIVALANLLKVNIAVVQGGEKGDIDIEHIEPLEGTAAPDGDEQGSIILCYMYNGHYDAVVDNPDVENPDYDTWSQQRGEDDYASETLARKLQAEEEELAKQLENEVYEDFRLARAIMAEEREAAAQAETRQSQVPAGNVKLTLLAHRAALNQGINEEVNHYDTIDEARMGVIPERKGSDASSVYEPLYEAQTSKNSFKKKEDGVKPPGFFRQRSLSLTPGSKGLQLSLKPEPPSPTSPAPPAITRARSQSLTLKEDDTIKDYTDEDIKKFLKPISTLAAKKKFAYLDII